MPQHTTDHFKSTTAVLFTARCYKQRLAVNVTNRVKWPIQTVGFLCTVLCAVCVLCYAVQFVTFANRSFPCHCCCMHYAASTLLRVKNRVHTHTHSGTLCVCVCLFSFSFWPSGRSPRTQICDYVFIHFSRCTRKQNH